MAPLALEPLLRGGGPGRELEQAQEEKRFSKGNAPRFFRTRFTGFHIMFRSVDIRKPGHMVAALSIVALFSLVSTILYFMMSRFEKRAILTRRRRWAAAPMFALRLLFAYSLVLLVEVMNIWVIFAVAVGHMVGWLLYFLYVEDCLGGAGGPGDGGDGGGGDDKRPHFDDSSVSSRSSDAPRHFWDLA